jgi:NarL family two-component system sensor histidine kinase LiaS
MANFFRLVLFFLCAILLAGSQCSTEKNSSIDSELQTDEQQRFSKDSIEFQKLCKETRVFLFKDVKKARELATQALKLSQTMKWDEGKLISYNLISSAYLLDGTYDVLRELANETFTLAKTTGLTVYTAHARRFLGESYSEYREWDSARIHYDYAIKIFAKLGEDSARAVCIESLANCYREKDDYEPALAYYNEADQIYEKLNSWWGRASVLQNEGFLYLRKRDLTTAIKLFEKCVDIHREANNLHGELHALNDLANAYNVNKQFDLAIEAGKKALELSYLYQSDQQKNWALESVASGYRGKGELDQAISYLLAVHYNKKTKYGERHERQFTMYQLMYENEQMGSAIQKKIIDDQRSVQQILLVISALILSFAAILWFNNKKLRRKNAEIKEALIQGQTMERKRVAAELHDHLGGTLASLNWYLHGIDKKVLSEEEQKIYQSVHQMVGSAYKEVRSLSHNLMPAELEEHGLIMALNRLVDKINDGKLIKFNFIHSGLNKRYSNQVEFELYSIILELTNNILKHSGASEANIKLNETPKNIQLEISDNGTGMAAQTRDGVGLVNIKSRVQSLSGKLDIQSLEGEGTRIEIEIPNHLLN